MKKLWVAAPAVCLMGIGSGLVVNHWVLAPKIKADTFLSIPTAQFNDAKRDGQIVLTKPIVVEFMDYQCGPCYRSKQMVDDYKKQFPEGFQLVVRQFPLYQIHAHASEYAYAAEAARLQGKFPQMHEALFALQDSGPAPPVEVLARKVGLDVARFQKDIKGAAKTAVEKDLSFGRRIGIDATPTFVVCTPQGQVIRLASTEKLLNYIQ